MNTDNLSETVFHVEDVSKVCRIGEVEVLSGLEKGARVILHPANEIEDGARVKARGALEG